MFSRKKPKLTRESALALRPLHLVAAEMKPTADGGTLSVEVQPPRIARWLAGKFERRRKTFEFDAIGLFVWQQIDGRTSVQQIIRRLSEKYDLNLRMAEASTLAFLQMLLKRGLIGLPVPDDDKAAKKKQAKPAS